MRKKIEKKEMPRCKICGKRLKTLESIQLGYGDICFNKFVKQKSERNNLLEGKDE